MGGPGQVVPSSDAIGLSAAQADWGLSDALGIGAVPRDVARPTAPVAHRCDPHPRILTSSLQDACFIAAMEAIQSHFQWTPNMQKMVAIGSNGPGVRTGSASRQEGQVWLHSAFSAMAYPLEAPRGFALAQSQHCDTLLIALC